MNVDDVKNYFFLGMVALIAIVLAFMFAQTTPPKYPPPNAEYLPHWQEPLQKEQPGTKGIKYKFGKLQFMAKFKISGAVLLKTYVSDDAYSHIAPIDLTIGWQYMSEPEIYGHLKFGHHNRLAAYSGSTTIKKNQIIANFANVSVIPANIEIWNTIKNIRPGDRVTMAGYLVNYNEYSQYHTKVIKSSLSLYDAGEGSNELMYVMGLSIYEHGSVEDLPEVAPQSLSEEELMEEITQSEELQKKEPTAAENIP